MLIVTLGFAVLLITVTSIVGQYSGQAKTDLMDNAAKVTKLWVEKSLEHHPTETFSSLILSEGDQIDELLNSFAEDRDEMTVLFALNDGTVFSSFGKNANASDMVGSRLPSDVTQKVLRGEVYQSVLKLSFHRDRVLLRAVGIYEDGALCGIAAVYSTNIRWGNMVEQVTDTVMTSALLIFLAALIAPYFISERIMNPLREMSRVAKNFASGNFKARVRVRGRDEVAALAIAFNEMADSLENLESMRSTFIANVSHDLRTPMTTIAGFIDGIRDGVIPKEEQDYYLDVVSSEVGRLSRMVSSLLDLSRIQAGARKFVMKPFDICEMARVILISFEQQIEEKRLDVSFECENDRVLVVADYDAIYQVLYNISHNAVKFAREEGVLRIRIAHSKDRKVRVSIYNDGQGIPPADIPFVFERFYKSDKSRGLDKAGVGLGLYISKMIIAAHGEKIWVDGEYTKNCEFSFTLARASHSHFHLSDASTETADKQFK